MSSQTSAHTEPRLTNTQSQSDNRLKETPAGVAPRAPKWAYKVQHTHTHTQRTTDGNDGKETQMNWWGLSSAHSLLLVCGQFIHSVVIGGTLSGTTSIISCQCCHINKTCWSPLAKPAVIIYVIRAWSIARQQVKNDTCVALVRSLS